MSSASFPFSFSSSRFRATLTGNEFATAIDVGRQHITVHLLYVIFNSETNTASITYDVKQQMESEMENGLFLMKFVSGAFGICWT